MGLPTEEGLLTEGVCLDGDLPRGVVCLRVFGQITPKTRKVASTHPTEMLSYL